ncbi:MAG: TlpA family protein disulfide reductase [Phycisphaerales bacterium]|nr:TlpA family protein disulfide reductase [Planctomycetota bacterium]MCH8509659.1 TlpA family protein disulfide reductase [Phycisphaerales bacterium]
MPSILLLAFALLTGAGLMIFTGSPEDSAEDASAERLPEVDPALYAAADWPAHNENLYAKNLQGQRLPVALGKETWLTEKRPLEGRVVVLDFWATWCGPCIAAKPKLAQMQERHKDTLVVLGVSGQNEDVDTVRSYLADKKDLTVAYIHDEQQRVFKPFESRGIPLVVLMSTDGVIRWIGNPHAKAFDEAVEQVLRVDPLIAARTRD